ncbi:hypothetical protein KSS87_002160, partial [Heliosperma pusillum]
MGKVSPKQKGSKTPKQRRRTRASTKNKYLRPAALAQLRYTKSATSKGCTDLGKKRVALSDLKKVDDNDLVIDQEIIPLPESQLMMSPKRFMFSMVSPLKLVKQCSLPNTPKTPRCEDYESESRLESLPMDLLVKIICHLHHDQLRAAFHVSQTVRMAGESRGFRMPSPHTPKAPRHGPRPPSRLKYTETRQVAAALFQESSVPS